MAEYFVHLETWLTVEADSPEQAREAAIEDMTTLLNANNLAINSAVMGVSSDYCVEHHHRDSAVERPSKER